MREGDALGLGCHDDIVFTLRHTLSQRPGSRLHKLGIAQNIKDSDPQAWLDFKNPKFAMHSVNFYRKCFWMSHTSSHIMIMPGQSVFYMERFAAGNNPSNTAFDPPSVS